MSEVIIRENDSKIDELEYALLHYPPAQIEIKHLFTKGLYCRAMYAKKGGINEMVMLTSMPHKTEHPFFLMQGELSISIDGSEGEIFKAPHAGITKSGTRRVAVVHEDVIWITAHALPFIKGNENELPENEKQKVIEKVEKAVLENRVNELVLKDKNKKLWHS